MPLFKPPQGTHLCHEDGADDREYTLAGDILDWNGELYEWDETRTCFGRFESGPPPGWEYVYFLEPNVWMFFIPVLAELRRGTFE